LIQKGAPIVETVLDFDNGSPICNKYNVNLKYCSVKLVSIFEEKNRTFLVCKRSNVKRLLRPTVYVIFI